MVRLISMMYMKNMKYLLLILIIYTTLVSCDSQCYSIVEMYDRDTSYDYKILQTDSISFYYDDGPAYNITIVVNYNNMRDKVYLVDAIGYPDVYVQYNGTYKFEDGTALTAQSFPCSRFKFTTVPDNTVYSPTGNMWNHEKLSCNTKGERFNDKLSDMNNTTISIMDGMYVTGGIAITAYGGNTQPTNVRWCGQFSNP